MPPPSKATIGVILPKVDYWDDKGDKIFQIIQSDVNDYLSRLELSRFQFGVPEIIFEIRNANDDPEIHNEFLDEFFEDKVSLIIGGAFSNQADAARIRVHAREMVLLSPLSTSDDLNTVGDFLFRLLPVDSSGIESLVHIFNDLGIRKVITFQVLDPVGDVLYKKLFDMARLFGIDVSTRIPFAIGTEDFSSKLVWAENQATNSPDEAVVFLGSFEIYYLIGRLNAIAFPKLLDKKWFLDEDSSFMLGFILDSFPFKASQIQLFTPIAESRKSSKFYEMNQRFLDKGWEELTFYDACWMDAAWLLVQSLLEAYMYPRDNREVGRHVRRVLPHIAARHYGYSGWCGLDSAGDRKVKDYEIKAIGTLNNQQKIVVMGKFDSYNKRVIWF